jgi:hypothetical protein
MAALTNSGLPFYKRNASSTGWRPSPWDQDEKKQRQMKDDLTPEEKAQGMKLRDVEFVNNVHSRQELLDLYWEKNLYYCVDYRKDQLIDNISIDYIKERIKTFESVNNKTMIHEGAAIADWLFIMQIELGNRENS